MTDSTPESETRQFGLRELHELISDCRMTVIPGGLMVVVRARLLMWLALGEGAVFAMAAAAWVWIAGGMVGGPNAVVVVLSVVILAPGVVAGAIGVYLACWRRECRIDRETGEAVFRERRWLRWSEQRVGLRDVEVRVRRFSASLYPRDYRGRMMEVSALGATGGVRPLVIARGKPARLAEVSRVIDEETGLKVGGG